MSYHGYGGTTIDMRGTIDMHIHPYPDIFPRLADDVEIARAARDAGLRAVLYKCHHENTVSRAYMTNSIVPGIDVVGGVVLNSFVGGINPAAAEAALRFGGRIVWLPTIDSPHHIETHGGSRNLVGLSSSVGKQQVVAVTSSDGNLLPEVFDVLDVIAEYRAALATSHVSPREAKLLVTAAQHRGIDKIVLTHPFYKTPGMSLDDVQDLVRKGAVAEFGYCDYSAMWNIGDVGEVVDAVRTLGAENCLLVSDSGQMHNPMPGESLRIFAQTVLEKGIPETDVYTMIRDVPARLIGLDDPSSGYRRIQGNWAESGRLSGSVDPASQNDHAEQPVQNAPLSG
jgi:hypothetical protein